MIRNWAVVFGMYTICMDVLFSPMVGGGSDVSGLFLKTKALSQNVTECD